MQWLAEVCVKRPVFATMLILSLVVVGMFSFFSLGVDLFPKIDFPTITVTVVNPGASPEEIETEITELVEESVNTISGIDELRSSSIEGISRVFVQFVLEKDVEVAFNEVQQKVQNVIPRLPTTAEQPTVLKLDTDAAPVLRITLSGTDSVRNVTEVARGENHTIALTVDGTVWAWGFNSSGQLGNNSTTVSLVPVPVAGLGNVVAVSGGQNHTLALKADGTVWSWGANSWGQLGNNSTVSSRVPVPVAGLNNVIAVSGGFLHSLALKSDGTVWAWGQGLNGRLGINSTGNRTVPVQVKGPAGVGVLNLGPSGSQPGTLVLSNDTPIWDNAPPAGPSTQLRWTVSSGATSYEVFRNGTKIYPTSGTYSGLSFRNELGLTAGQTYTYQIVASNPAGTRQSNTVVVGPMPGAPVAPTISSVLPAAIPQGNGYQDVTLTGSGLTGASWHEFSTDGGATWVPAESSPVVNSSTSITVGVNNTIVRTVRIRVCAAYGSALCSSGSVPVTIQASATPIAPTTATCCCTKAARPQSARLRAAVLALSSSTPASS